MKSETKICQNCKHDFVIEPDDFGFYEKMGVPAPTMCPKCRRIRRLSWRNDTTLYSRECSLCTKKFVSIYSPDKEFNVLCPKCFHGDGWNPYDYGVDYDTKKSFIEQIIDLSKKIPILGVVNDNDIASINCLYTNDVAFSKNCAMVFVCWKLENVFNSSHLAAGKDLSDCLCIAEECSYTYDGVMINNVANCKSIYWSTSCLDCFFSYDLRGCSDCFMCFGLRNKKYFFKNKQYTKEEYKKILESYKLDTRTGYKKTKEEFKELIKKYPRKFAELRNCVNCSGSDMIRSKNTHHASFTSFSEDSKYIHNGVSFKSSYDCSGAGETELSYECITPDNSYHSIGTIESWKNSYVAYCIDCHSSQNLLGCVGIKKGEYSILNKKYSKEEYNILYKKIVEDMKARGEWGEFFPIKYSPFGVKETQAIKELNFSKEEALAFGYKWQDSIQETKGKETISQEKVHDSINDVNEDILNEILSCTNCSRNYKILEGELVLYYRLLIPIPTECFFCRNKEREKMRGGYDLINRQCDCMNDNHGHTGRCEANFDTFFTKKEQRPIYCEDCYQKELI
jgi:hypothetical protein